MPPRLLAKSETQVAREVEEALGAGYKDYLLFWGSIDVTRQLP